MDASKLPKLKSQEVNSNGAPVSLPGIYRHRDTNAVFITVAGEEGSMQADMLHTPIWKDAWERVGEVPTRLELQAMRKLQEQKDVIADAVAKEADEAELKAAIEDYKKKLKVSA